MNRNLRRVLSGSAIALLMSIVGCGKSSTPHNQTDMSMPAADTVESLAEDPEQQLIARLGGLGGVQSERGWVVALPNVRFKAGQTDFDPADATRLDGVTQLLKDRPQIHVLVESFTDARGGTSRNNALSQERAEAVQRALVERGIDAARIRAEGRGEVEPIASNDTAAGRQQNRRIELTFSDVNGQFASAGMAPTG